MRSILYLVILIAVVLTQSIVAGACPNLQGEYTCNGQRTVITQSAIQGGMNYTIQEFQSSTNPTEFTTEEYMADGLPHNGQGLSEEDGGTPVTTCGSTFVKSAVNYLYWGLNPVHVSKTFSKLSNGNIKISYFQWMGSSVVPRSSSQECTLKKTR